MNKWRPIPTRVNMTHGREITVYDGPSGSRTLSLYFGIEYYPEHAFHGVVTIGDSRDHVFLIRSTTIEPRADHEQLLVDLASSLEPVPYVLRDVNIPEL